MKRYKSKICFDTPVLFILPVHAFVQSTCCLFVDFVGIDFLKSFSNSDSNMSTACKIPFILFYQMAIYQWLRSICFTTLTLLLFIIIVIEHGHGLFMTYYYLSSLHFGHHF